MKFVVLRKRTLIVILCLVLVVSGILGFSFMENMQSAESVFSPNRRIPIYNVKTDEKKVAISFDAAWGADKTEAILNVLNHYGIKATFFLVGFWTEKHADLVKKIDEYGMEIGTHSNNHSHMSKLTETQIKSDLETSMSLISDITKKKVLLFRAPFGEYNNTLIDVADSLSLKTIQWDVDSLDWKGISANEITNRIVGKVKNGSIILCHNNSEHIVEALPGIIEKVVAKGYKFVPIGELIYSDDFRIDSNGVQIKNQ